MNDISMSQASIAGSRYDRSPLQQGIAAGRSQLPVVSPSAVSAAGIHACDTKCFLKKIQENFTSRDFFFVFYSTKPTNPARAMPLRYASDRVILPVRSTLLIVMGPSCLVMGVIGRTA